ncbi:MAG: valine--tRNA ligase [Anaerolineae bacterium]|nr:valine--tRNA ligase [Anaerolineae bacterium]
MYGKEMSRTYDPQDAEERLYEFWEKKGYFTPEIDWDRQPFTIVIPPPNITGELHHGHAMFIAFEDLMIRYHRMLGEPTLWLPGSDHAGISTQNVVEKELAKEGLTRHDVGREKFEELLWEWREEYGGIITNQLRRLGASCDWTRERFTLDEGLSRAVREAFVNLHRKGLIYRGEYIINWCPRCQTALSDLETPHEDEGSHLWYVRYPLEEGGYIEVATTRPETILGDTAVAVNPYDNRYRDMVGKIAILPVLGRRIPIIADEAVDPAFGTGAVKVTPGHDPTDYEIGQRHGLEMINIMNLDATLNDEAGPYRGMDRYEAREKLVEDLREQGLLVKIEPHLHAPGRCQRCQTMVEPLVSEQWFVKIKPLAEPAIEAVRDGRIRIIPDRFTKVYYNWMENIRDWCISRQLWWGHRIPVWYCDDCLGQTVATVDPTECEHCGGQDIRQDPDVLDTWFSSGLWPFSTLGWPGDTDDLRYFYPTSVMETGYDILFFWVARMIMLGMEHMGDVPFREIYLHGLMRDEDGVKMSKSKGNVANPLDVVAQYGADALRFTIITGSSPGEDMKLYAEKLESSRNFANKLWQMARFITANLPEGYELPSGGPEAWPRLRLEDRWILSRHNRVISEVTRLLDSYQFGEAGRQIYEFLWSEFADWFIEASKVRLYGEDEEDRATARQVLVYVFERALRLLHPFMPFVTEEMWQHLPHQGESLMIAPWPDPGPVDEEAESVQGEIWQHVRDVRNRRAEERWPVEVKPASYTVAGDLYDALDSQKDVFAWLARAEPRKISSQREPVPAGSTVVTGQLSTTLVVEVDVGKERERLGQELSNLEGEIARSEQLLANEGFVSKAPGEVVCRERDKLARYQKEREKLKEELRGLGE